MSERQITLLLQLLSTGTLSVPAFTLRLYMDSHQMQALQLHVWYSIAW